MADYEDEKENRFEFPFSEENIIPFGRFEHFREVKAPSLQGQESQSTIAFRFSQIVGAIQPLQQLESYKCIFSFISSSLSDQCRPIMCGSQKCKRTQKKESARESTTMGLYLKLAPAMGPFSKLAPVKDREGPTRPPNPHCPCLRRVSSLQKGCPM